jgi:putative sterol carrier protein
MIFVWPSNCCNCGVFVVFVCIRANALTGRLKARVAFNLTSDTEATHKKKWVLHMKAGEPPSVFLAGSVDEKLDVKPDATLVCTDSTLLEMAKGELSPEYAYMRGKLQVKGNVTAALGLKQLFGELSSSLL